MTEQSFGVRIDRKKRPADFCMEEEHAHEEYELFYMLSGRCRIFLNHTIYHMKAGDMLLIEPHALHRTMYGITQDNERVDIMFEKGYIDEMNQLCKGAWLERLKKHPFLPIEAGRRTYVEMIFQRLLAEQQSEDCFSEVMKQHYLYELLVFLGRHETSEKQISHSEMKEHELPIQQAALYIYTHYEEPLTLEIVAELVHMSPTYFSRRFKQITGFGYKEYVNHVRLKEASRLLLETNLSLNEIARLCGFSDSNYFGDLFKKEKGMSPRMYRRNPQM